MKKISSLLKMQSMIVLLLIFTVLSILVSMVFFSFQINSYVEEDMYTQLAAMQKSNVQLIESEVNHLLQITKSAALLMDETHLESSADIVRILQGYAHSSGLVRTLFITLEGDTYSNYAGDMGHHPNNTSLDGVPLGQIQTAILSHPFYDEEVGKVIFGVVCPATLMGREGVLISSYDIVQFSDLLKSEFIGGTVEVGIVNRKGEVIVGKGQEEFHYNIFEGLSQVSFGTSSAGEMQENFAQGRLGFASYTLEDNEHFCAYSPISANDWFAVTVVKKASLYANLQKLELFGVRLTLNLVVIMSTMLIFVVTILYLEQKKVQKVLTRAAMTDGLTEIYNRNAIEKEITAFLSSNKNWGHSAILVLDVDNFKCVNDTMGHLVGDHVLQQCAKSLTHAFGEENAVGRIGGDEFVVLVKHFIDLPQLERMVAGFMEQFSTQTTQQEGIHISASVGVTLLQQGDTSFSDPYQRADQALYRAKQSGKGNFVLS